MLKKTSYEEPGSVAAQANQENSPEFVQAGANDTAEPPLTISSANKDIPRVGATNVSVFGSTLVFKGELSADEELLIQGKIEGTIAHHNKTVIVGKQGRVKALIHANSIKIEGRVDGDIHGDEFVMLAAGAVVNGNIYCPRIRLDDGAQFNGTIQMGQKPKLSVADGPH